MVKILLNKRDVMNVLAWGGKAQADAKNVSIPFDSDEMETLKKFKDL